MRLRRHALELLAALAACAALVHAIALRWLCDDAFISFRYARRLASGEGLTFNPGEPVEGYSNFLWTLLLALGARLGVAPEDAAIALGLASYAGIFALLFWVGRSLAASARHADPPRRGWLPLAALAWAAVYHGRVFATSGLETSLFTLLATGAIVAAIAAPRLSRDTLGRWTWVALLGALAGLCRPEGWLFGAVALAPALISRRASVRLRLLAVAPFGGALVAHEVFRLAYYGALLPNTWLAKGAGGPHLEQGATYLGVFFFMYWPLLLGALGAGVVLARVLPVTAAWPTAAAPRTDDGGWRTARAPALILGATVPYLLYVAAVGGDFMFARFCLPVAPLLLVGCELGLARATASRRVRLAASVVLVAGLVLAPYPSELAARPDDAPPGVAGIVEERSFYPAETVAGARRAGGLLAEALAGSEARVAFFGTQAMLVYWADPHFAIDDQGLVDRAVAGLPAAPGRRPGHGRAPDLDYWTARGIDLVFPWRYDLEPPHPDLRRVSFGGEVGAWFVVYRRELAALLAARGYDLVDMEVYLDGYLLSLDRRPRDEALSDFAFFERYYFAVNDDPEREDAFRRRLGLAP